MKNVQGKSFAGTKASRQIQSSKNKASKFNQAKIKQTLKAKQQNYWRNNFEETLHNRKQQLQLGTFVMKNDERNAQAVWKSKIISRKLNI